MVKASLKKQNPPITNTNTNTPKKKITKTKSKSKRPRSPSQSSDSDTEPNTPDQILNLISPLTKDQLIDLIITAAVKTPTLYTHITNSADNDVSNRKIFVFGLAWDATKETVKSAFNIYGEIEDCNVVMDKVTGKAKGFGFVQFRYRKGASKALKEPKKKIGNRMVNCQLASLGHGGSGSGSGGVESNVGRKVYVSNVGPDIDSERLRAFFERFGEIEMGPLGFDNKTGKSKGYALFIYRSQDGFRKCLEEPVKMFEGCKLHCQRANGKNKVVGPATVNAAPVVPPQMMANFGMFGQGQLGLGLNPMFGGLIVDPRTGLISANPMYGSGLLGQVSGVPGGLSGYYGGVPAGYNVGVDSGSLLGGYGGASSSSILPGVGLQSVYPQKKEGSSPASGSASGSRSQGAGGSFSGYPSHMR